VTDAPVTITEGALSPSSVMDVLSLASAAKAADGVAPLSEDALLDVGHGRVSHDGASSDGASSDGTGQEQPDGAKDFLLRLPDGTLAGYAQLALVAARTDADPSEKPPGESWSGELLIHPGHRNRGLGTALAAALTAGDDGRDIRIWAHGDLPAAAALAKSAGFARLRSLWQMRLSLADAAIPAPAFPAGVTVRTFRPGLDEEAWLEVNKRAFAHHPEQGSWTRRDIALREAEPWFDPDGFFLAERDGELAGFHWTKVHAGGGEGGTPIGEVYVVGVDPGRQGGGLGRALTLAGLAHLSGLGLAAVLLYVDESNTAAVRMYAGLGFTRWSTDVMYQYSR
jgi:mycothiol synthase